MNLRNLACVKVIQIMTENLNMLKLEQLRKLHFITISIFSVRTYQIYNVSVKSSHFIPSALSFNALIIPNLVISSISNYFNNSETPIICYKYNKPIRSTIFNFNKIDTEIDIDTNTPDS